jgi:hypothetical protein
MAKGRFAHGATAFRTALTLASLLSMLIDSCYQSWGRFSDNRTEPGGTARR